MVQSIRTALEIAEHGSERFTKVHDTFTIPAHKRLIIVRGAPSQERDIVAVSIAMELARACMEATGESFAEVPKVHRLENFFYRTTEQYYFDPERLHDAIEAVHKGIVAELATTKLPVVTAGTFVRRKHMMEYVYEGCINKHELLVLEVVSDKYTPNEAQRSCAEAEMQTITREHFLHAFSVSADCQFTAQGVQK